MKHAWKISGIALLALAALLIALPVSMYIILSTSWAQDSIRRVAVKEISTLLATDVTIDRVEIHPFNRLSVYGVKALDDNGKTALTIDEVSAAFEFFHLLRTGRLVIDYALLKQPAVALYRTTPDSPLNIADILGRLKSKDPNKPKSKYDLSINTVAVIDGKLAYDVVSAAPDTSHFDRNHIRVTDLQFNAYVPVLANDNYRLEVDRLSFVERSGFRIDNIELGGTFNSDSLRIKQFAVTLPNSSLVFNPVSLPLDGMQSVADALDATSVTVSTKEASKIYPPDFSAFVPALANIDRGFSMEFESSISRRDIDILQFRLTDEERHTNLDMSAAIHDLAKKADAGFEIRHLHLRADRQSLDEIIGSVDKARGFNKIINRLKPGDKVSLDLVADGRLSLFTLKSKLSLASNMLSVSGTCSSADSLRTADVRLRAKARMPNLHLFAGGAASSSFACSDIRLNGHIAKKNMQLNMSLDSAAVAFGKFVCNNIALDAALDRQRLTSTIRVADQNLSLEADCNAEIIGKEKNVDMALTLDRADLAALGALKDFPGYLLSAKVDAIATFTGIDDIDGALSVSDLVFADNDPKTHDLRFDNINIDCIPTSDHPGIRVESDYLNGYLAGQYRLSTFMQSVKGLVFSVLPSLAAQLHQPEFTSKVIEGNDFNFDFKLSECDSLCKFLRLPVSVIHDISVNGHLSDSLRTARISVDAPYLLQGDKIIESTSLFASVDALDDRIAVRATSKIPTKKGLMAVSANLTGASDRIDNRVDWIIERKIPINGSFDFSTTLIGADDGEPSTIVSFNPGTITFGDEVWSIRPSTLVLGEKYFNIDQFRLEASDEHIAVNGVVSDSPDDILNIDLRNIALLDIFETLEIDKALIGGTATGAFEARNLLSQTPEISCPDLHVDSISYNRCVLGDAEIVASWNADKKSFYLDADITGEGGRHSRIYGDIFPSTESLDINFDVDHAPVGFMKPFVSAFASDLSGYASGKARLFGTFKYIDMEGDIFADDLKIKIDFTNTWYTATDSIRLTPGLIDIKDVTIRDRDGHTALLNGVVRHKFFKEPSFDFKVTQARDFLSYDVDPKLSPDWYGTVYGNGGATITGEPGVVNIGVNMSTAPKSTFTFVLSDRLDADEYSFITFKDSQAQARRDSLAAADNLPAVVRSIRSRLSSSEGDSPSAYNMDLRIDITPDARMILVMDPVGGDEIKATGAGNLRLTYESLNNDLKMYGTYRLDRGSYNFTLQDIIIKDFTIRDGSTIAFHGDPYSAQLDIEAIYSVNANLSDLDESFLLDKDLNRTNVPVHALLKVTGDMRQPDIDFDLEFPTLTSDTYRKVRSIVSTREMMNRQIIYLLALNRFYTPDYMASTTKGNELFSVASSTISSQLSSILGKLSDDWSIAPNLRSDRGDFSDVEVDVALSSRLLNNRLLFNGNFGYRDKTLNTNQFIGDFDIEYLLNRRGSWRLKAYNRYNDQNYYVRTAQTTQGVGIVFKRDFDNFFGFLRPKKKKEENIDTVAPQEKIVIPDSIANPPNPLLQE